MIGLPEENARYTAAGRGSSTCAGRDELEHMNWSGRGRRVPRYLLAKKRRRCDELERIAWMKHRAKGQGLSKQQRGVDEHESRGSWCFRSKSSGVSCCYEFVCYGDIYSKYLVLLFGLTFTKKSCPELELYAASAVVSHGCDHLGYDFRFRLLKSVGR